MTTTSTGDGPAPAPAALAPVPPRPRVRPTDLLAGLPALAGAAAVAAVLGAGASLPLADAYAREAGRRWARNDLPGALVCIERLDALRPGDLENRYFRVIALERLGKVEEAEDVARSVAPDDREGFPRAHYWMAGRLITDPARFPARAAAVERHLKIYLQAEPKSEPARVMLGKFYRMTGRPSEARSVLESVPPGRPDRSLELARACRDQGDEAEAARHAREARDAAEATVAAHPDDNTDRFIWADACALLDDFPGAVRALGPATDPARVKLKANVYASWAASLARRKAPPAERLAVLQDGLRLDPANPQLLGLLAGVMIGGDGREAEEARAAIREALASGRLPVLAHFALGNDAWARGRVGEARDHWERAHALNPELVLAANNLAWLLASQEPVDLPRAKGLIDGALGLAPGDPRLRVTRGQILSKMGRWKDAVPDLEYALANRYDDPSLHGDLAEAYDHLGMPAIAAEHRKLVKP